MANNKRGTVASPALPFLFLQTDDRKKQVHHEALAEILTIFRRAGMTSYNVSHIDDPERNPDIPIKIGSHIFDLSFPKDKNTFVLLEVKILKLLEGPPEKCSNGKSKR